jgi:hypothetical protein
MTHRRCAAMLLLAGLTIHVSYLTASVGRRVAVVGVQAQSAGELNPLNRAMRQAFTQRNPAVTRVTVLELRLASAQARTYVLLGRGIRPDLRFQGSLDDELFGVFLVDSGLTRIERTLEIFPTQRWNDYIVSIEKVTDSEVTIVGGGSYGDQRLRRVYKLQPPN